MLGPKPLPDDRPKRKNIEVRDRARAGKPVSSSGFNGRDDYTKSITALAKTIAKIKRGDA